MEEGSKYRQLRSEERVAIAGMKLQGASMRAMAKMLGRSASTVSRGLRRNAMIDGGCDAPVPVLVGRHR